MSDSSDAVVPGATRHVTFPLRPSNVDRVPSPKTQRGPPGSAGRTGLTQTTAASGIPFTGWYRLFVQAVSDFSSPRDLTAAELTCRRVRALILTSAVWQTQFERFDRERRRRPYPAPQLTVSTTSPPNSPTLARPEQFSSSWLINDVTQEEIDDCYRRNKPLPPRSKVELPQEEWKRLLLRSKREDVTAGGRGCPRHWCVDPSTKEAIGLQVVCRAHVDSAHFQSRRRPLAIAPYRLMNDTRIDFGIRSMSIQDNSRVALMLRSNTSIAMAVHLLAGGVQETPSTEPFETHRPRGSPPLANGPYVITSSARNVFHLTPGNSIGGCVCAIEEFAHKPEVAVLFEAAYLPPYTVVKSRVGRYDRYVADLLDDPSSNSGASTSDEEATSSNERRPVLALSAKHCSEWERRVRSVHDFIPVCPDADSWPNGLLTTAECPIMALRYVMEDPSTTAVMRRLLFEHLSGVMRDDMPVVNRTSIMSMVLPQLLGALERARTAPELVGEQDDNELLMRIAASELESVYSLIWNVTDCSHPAVPLNVLYRLFSAITYHTFIRTKIVVSTRSGGVFVDAPSKNDVVMRLSSIWLMPRVRTLQGNIGCLWNVIYSPDIALKVLEVPLMFWSAVECLAELSKTLETSGSLPAGAVFSLSQFVACVLHHAPLGSFAVANRAAKRNLRAFANETLRAATSALLHRTTSTVQIGAVVACRDTVEFGVEFIRHGRCAGVISHGTVMLQFAYFLAAGVELPPPQMLNNDDDADLADGADDGLPPPAIPE